MRGGIREEVMDGCTDGWKTGGRERECERKSEIARQ
jgi:hypothetical protein